MSALGWTVGENYSQKSPAISETEASEKYIVMA